MGEPRTVGVFGGSFNPPHVSHVLAAAYAKSVFDELDELLVVPVFRHPFAKELAPFEHRRAMCELAMGWIPGVSVSSVEEELGGESLTLRTLEHLTSARPHARFRLLVGADVLNDAHKWHKFERVKELAPLLVLGRGGVHRSDAPVPVLPTVSSSEVREALRAGERDRLRPLVPARVLAYVEAHGLYR
jgi:nicotinate-nucleotide adenylyltransferase